MEKVPGVVVVKYDAETPTGGQEAIGAIKAAGITSLDVLCVNAAVVLSHAHFKELDYDTAIRMHKVNVLGPMVLFQAALPMLHAGAKVCLVSSGAGTMSNKTHRAGGGVYGMSKASLNFMVGGSRGATKDRCARWPWSTRISSYSVSAPGGSGRESGRDGAETRDMGNDGARANGMDQAPLEVSETLRTSR